MVPDCLLRVLSMQVVLGSQVAKDGSGLRQHHPINFNQRHLAKKQAPICGLSKERLRYSPSMAVVSLQKCPLLILLNDFKFLSKVVS